jgi:rifampicin phosphotransferase
VLQEMSDFPYLMTARMGAVLVPSRHYEIWIYLWAWLSNGNKGANAMRDRLLRAVPFITALQNQAVGELVKIAKAHGKDSSEYKSALADFITEWGSRPARGVTMMPSIPSWREAPEVVNGLVDALISDWTAAPEEALRRDEADFRTARAEVEARLWSPLRRLFHRHLEFARNGLIGREDGRYRMEIMTTQIRHTALLLGDMLVTAGMLSSRDDVLFLLANELEPVAQGKLDPTERIARRKQGFARLVAANERVQHWLVASGSIAAPKPKKAKRSAKPADDHSLSGRAAAPGVATGPVCVVHGPHEFSKLRKGDVLVAPFTAPVWTSLFRLASAVVTEIGGAAGHAAIVAREYGIPAVVAVPRATTLLRDGQRVRVDGVQETVTIVDAAQK